MSQHQQMTEQDIVELALESARKQGRHTPRDYQYTGINFFLDNNVEDPFRNASGKSPTTLEDRAKYARHLLADAPGAGKTIQGIEAAQQSTPPLDSILIIAPSHLCGGTWDESLSSYDGWFGELLRQYPNDTIVNCAQGSQKQRLEGLRLRARWYIVSHQMMRRKIYADAVTELTLRHSLAHRVTTVVIDESHYLKNHRAKSQAYIHHLVNNTKAQVFIPRVYMLTATPIVREGNDLFGQLNILDPWTFKGHQQFLTYYCHTIWGAYGPERVDLRSNAMQAFERRKYILTRGYDDIGLALPPLIAKNVPINLSPSRQKKYNDLKQKYITELLTDPETGEIHTIDAASAMELMHLLRHIVNSPEKREATIDTLQDSPGPYVIFCMYRKSVTELANDLRNANLPHKVTEIHGGIPADQHVPLALQALNSPNDIVIATMPSLSEGCDLSHANTVIFYEENWTPGSMRQAVSRIHRHRNEDKFKSAPYGPLAEPNTHPILSFHMLAANTIDMHIHQVQASRAASVKDIMRVELNS